jgi:hypothetical protein
LGKRNWPELVGFFEATFFLGPKFRLFSAILGQFSGYRFERGRLPPSSGGIRVAALGIAG